ncbi:MAG: signal peptidase, partial [Pseudomonadota bacterium]
MMQAITSLILAAFAAYVGAWYVGMLEGNFSLLLFLATVVTGIYWLAERFYFLPQRKKAAAALEAQVVARHAELSKMGISKVDGDVTEGKQRLLAQPWWLFPVIIAVFILRSFLFEPFKIPSGSMIPTLWVGDLILVNKFHYGLRLPVLNTKITEGTPPQRGDVMVFRYPPKPSLDYIKRVVGVPGDEVAYLNKRLTINGKPLPTNALPEFFDEDAMRYFPQFEETLGTQTHRLLNDPARPAFIPGADEFEFKNNCRYSVEGV